MRIRSVELHHISMRLRSPFQTSFGIEHDRECIILRAEAGDLTGWGECVAGREPGYSYETVGTAWHVLTDFFIPAVLGAPLTSPGELEARLSSFKGHHLAQAGLQMALWDLHGKLEGRSLRQMLGGEQDRVAVGVSIGIQATIDALIETAGEYLRQGYRRLKVKIEPGRDLDPVQAVREAFPGTALQVDANSAYTLEQHAVFEGMDSLDLLLIEQPLAEDDLVDHADLQGRLRTPICLDESICSVRHARQALQIGACRVINIKPARVGGLAQAAAIHDLCRREGHPVWCGGMLETGVGRAANLALASLPGFSLPGDISASDRYYLEDIAEPLFHLNADSTIDVPSRPGLGVEVSLKRLKRYSLRSTVLRA